MLRSFSSHGRKKTHIPGNLARYMFAKSARSNNNDPTELFFKLAAFVYSGAVNDEGSSSEAQSSEVAEFEIDEVEILDI